ncbi:MAG: hypothetical protein NXH94_20615 [Rhodobacteraceae bacterium]|nr:hypothetical protein [Paracoccaceae bacterium]
MFDHRATAQADRINATAHPVLQYVGGVISPEMQAPKLLWLKENCAEVFAGTRHFFDLTDSLTWKASGSTARSTCTVTCKWTYLAHEDRWDDSFFEAVGLGELTSGCCHISGRSHTHEEFSSIADIANGIQVLTGALHCLGYS